MRKKGILFLITLIFALTPGCKKQPKSVVHANAAIASGSTLTVIGTGGIGLAIALTTVKIVAAAFGGGSAATAALISATFFLPPVAFIAAGIKLIMIGVKNKKRIRKEQALAARSVAVDTHDSTNLSEQD